MLSNYPHHNPHHSFFTNPHVSYEPMEDSEKTIEYMKKTFPNDYNPNESLPSLHTGGYTLLCAILINISIALNEENDIKSRMSAVKKLYENYQLEYNVDYKLGKTDVINISSTPKMGKIMLSIMNHNEALKILNEVDAKFLETRINDVIGHQVICTVFREKGISIPYEDKFNTLSKKYPENSLLVFHSIPNDILLTIKDKAWVDRRIFWSYKQFDDTILITSLNKGTLSDNKYIFKYQKLSKSIIKSCIPKWYKYLIKYKHVSIKHILKRWDQLADNRTHILKYRDISSDILMKKVNDFEKTDWNIIAKYQKLTKKFISIHRKDLNTKPLRSNKKISFDFDFVVGLGLPLRLEDNLYYIFKNKKQFKDCKFLFT